MKRIILLLFLVSLSGYSQLNEGFESGIPTTWTVFDNGVGTAQSWGITTNAANVHSGSKAAEVVRGNIGQGNVSEHWLVTPLTSIMTNAQLRFFARSNFPGDNGTLYQIRISSPGATDPKDVSKYSTIKEYTELQLSAQATVYEEKVESLSSYAGTSRYIAFVRVFKQPSTQTAGDNWLLDDVKMVEQCFDPFQLTATNITAQSAVLGWSQASSAPLYDVEFGPAGFAQGTGTLQTSVANPYKATGLPPKTACQFYVKAKCSSGVESAWVGPFDFTTKTLGYTCAEPISIATLPFQVTGDNTSNYGDNYGPDFNQGSSCGTTSTITNYLYGNEVFYSYTPTTSQPVTITMTPIGASSTNSSLFVYAGCANVGVTCLTGKANSSLAARTVTFNAVAGQTYIIVISSGPNTQTIGYNLLMQAENCTKPSALGAANITSTSADLNWTSAGFSAWQVAVQPMGSPIPSGNGTYVTTNPYSVSSLTPGTNYQYWVRSECTVGSGIYSSWAGPYVFNTLVCEPAQTCNYTFRMTNPVSNGWNGATMQVRQNGIVVATIGSTFTTGAGPVDVAVPLCKDLPFDLFWDTAGSQPQQCAVSVINSFGQTIYTKASGAGTAGSVVYSNSATNCTAPVCIAPTDLSATSTFTSVTLSWSAPATTLWDVYLVPAGSPAPDASATPTQSNVNANPFTVSNLPADTAYDFYVRVVCSSSPSAWSAWSSKGTIRTVATCKRPTGLNVTGITLTSATLNWTKGTPTDSKWDILLVPSTTMTPPTQLPPANPSYPGMKLQTGITTPSPYTINTLTPATIYFYYVRTVCSATDSSVWEGPIVFNTSICNDSNKCTYQFAMTDAGGNGWDGGAMDVRQNGIVVATIGPGFSSAGPVYVSVPLCDGVPFDLYWKTAGTKPQEIGVQVLNSFQDVIFTKAPGTGNPSDVVYSSTVNCAKPACPKPTNLLAPQATVTTTSAQLSWTETGGGLKWEVYVVPAGSPAPDNSNPVSGVKPYYIADSNPFTIGNLSPSTKYTFYVRALCSNTSVSTWTILDPQTFITKPVNDECASATVLDVNPTRVPTLKGTGSTVGATQSMPDTLQPCTGFTDDDVWFSFVANYKTQIITITGDPGSADINHTVYSGTDCSALTQLYCSDPNVSVANNLIPGNTYKIRVYTSNSGLGSTASFSISVTTPPVITNDDCANAIQAPVNNDLPCVVTTSGSLTGASASAVASTPCVGSADDDVWFSFVANSTMQSISLINVTGTSNDLNYGVYGGDCGNLSLIFCSAAKSLTGVSAADAFEIGKTYYVRVWSNSNIPQDVYFDLCIGKILPPITADTTTYTPTQLVEDILMNTKCASVTNVTASTGVNFVDETGKAGANGIGYFNKSLSGFPFKDGIVLTSGNALEAPGPNKHYVFQDSKSWLGDADLNKIVTGDITYNASKLEFDFVPIGDKVSFNFIFASDEYGSFQCIYGDVFAFLLTNTVTGVTTNLAVVPNTSDLVSVTTIRNQLYNKSCNSVNEKYFSAFYNDGTANPFGDAGLNSLGDPTNYNGLTIPMVASSATQPGVKYHIKMVIADYKDQHLDSAIFLEGGSFNMGSVNLGPDVAGLCPGSSTTLVSNLDPSQYTFEWTKNDTVIPNETAPNLVVTGPGTYAIKARFGASSCFATDSVVIDYYQEVAPGKPKDLADCGSASSAVFDLTQNTALILAPYTTPHTVDYFLTIDDANNNINKIQAPANFTNTTNPQTIYARINNGAVSCYATTSFQVKIQAAPAVGIDTQCDGNNYKLVAIPVDGSFDGATTNYVWTGPEFTAVPGSPNTIILKTVGNYTVKITTADGCVTEESINVTDITCTIPKGISPNGDGKNDSFVLNDVKKLDIFNRYGTRVYSSTNYTNQWHGQTDQGRDLPDGTYFYQIERSNGESVSGWVYIIR